MPPESTAAVSKAISADNTFTDALLARSSPTNAGKYRVWISGTFVGTVTIQASSDGTTWHDVESFTSAVQKVGDVGGEDQHVRGGIKTGNYTSGTVTVRIAQKQ